MGIEGLTYITHKWMQGQIMCTSLTNGQVEDTCPWVWSSRGI
jgi:hypothetical protein